MIRLTELVMQGRQAFYSHLAGYPTHRSRIPSGIEEDFVHDLNRGSSSTNISSIHFELLTF